MGARPTNSKKRAMKVDRLRHAVLARLSTVCLAPGFAVISANALEILWSLRIANRSTQGLGEVNERRRSSTKVCFMSNEVIATLPGCFPCSSTSA